MRFGNSFKESLIKSINSGNAKFPHALEGV